MSTGALFEEAGDHPADVKLLPGYVFRAVALPFSLSRLTSSWVWTLAFTYELECLIVFDIIWLKLLTFPFSFNQQNLN